MQLIRARKLRLHFKSLSPVTFPHISISTAHTSSPSYWLLTARAFHRILREPRPHLYGHEETEDFRSLRAKRAVVKRAWIHSLRECGARSSFSRLVRCRPPTCCTLCAHRSVRVHDVPPRDIFTYWIRYRRRHRNRENILSPSQVSPLREIAPSSHSFGC